MPESINGIMYHFVGIYPINIPKIVPFNSPFKKSNRVGGVKTPPYEWAQLPPLWHTLLGGDDFGNCENGCTDDGTAVQ